MKNFEVLYARAMQIAGFAHADQTDKGGNPYIEHPIAVAEQLEEEELKVVAILHDVLEDSDTTAEDLLKSGFPCEIVEAVKVLTYKKTDPGTYEEYIARVAENPMAREVKICDIRHNMDLSRIPNPGKRDFQRCEKYKRALAYLENGGKDSLLRR
ncbi:MAG: GTP pyrophosphokinase [Marvinbryantia sp.]|jgi:(p)ppGpp synthase/HD superfamily hydrolase